MKLVYVALAGALIFSTAEAQNTENQGRDVQYGINGQQVSKGQFIQNERNQLAQRQAEIAYIKENGQNIGGGEYRMPDGGTVKYTPYKATDMGNGVTMHQGVFGVTEEGIAQGGNVALEQYEATLAVRNGEIRAIERRDDSVIPEDKVTPKMEVTKGKTDGNPPGQKEKKEKVPVEYKVPKALVSFETGGVK